MKGSAAIMRRPAGQQPHPLLVDCVVYVASGRDDAETEQRIAEACATAGVEPGRAVACIEQPPVAKPDRREARAGRGSRKAASRPDLDWRAATFGNDTPFKRS